MSVLWEEPFGQTPGPCRPFELELHNSITGSSSPHRASHSKCPSMPQLTSESSSRSPDLDYFSIHSTSHISFELSESSWYDSDRTPIVSCIQRTRSDSKGWAHGKCWSMGRSRQPCLGEEQWPLRVVVGRWLLLKDPGRVWGRASAVAGEIGLGRSRSRIEGDEVEVVML